MRLKGTTRGRVARQAGVEEEEEGRRGGGGGKRSLGSTGVKSRYQTQAALPPSFNPSLLSSKRPCHTSPLAPRQPATPGPPARPPLLLLFSRLPSPPRPIQTSAALPPSLPSSRKGRAGLGGQPPPRDVRLSRTHHRDDGVRRHLRALARAGLRRPSYKFGRRLDAPPLLLPFSIFFSSFSASLFGDENFLAGCRDAASSPCRANSPPSAKSELTEI